MPQIYVKFNELNTLGERLNNLSTKIDNINNSFTSTINSLDWDIKFKSDINETAKKLSHDMGTYRESLDSYYKFILEALERYGELENYQQGNHPSSVYSGGTFENSGSTNPNQSWLDSLGMAGKILLKMLQSFGPPFSVLGPVVAGGAAVAPWLSKIFGFDKLADGELPGVLKGLSKTVVSQVGKLFGLNIGFSAKEAFNLVGKAGKGAAAASWLGIFLDTAGNYAENLQEQKENGMSDVRVGGETFVETLTDIGFGLGMVGVASILIPGGPVVAAIGGTILKSFLDGCVNTVAKKSFSEIIADGACDIAEGVGNAVSKVGNAIAGWFHF